jgi:hypothetical protein
MNIWLTPLDFSWPPSTPAIGRRGPTRLPFRPLPPFPRPCPAAHSHFDHPLKTRVALKSRLPGPPFNIET